MYVYAATNNAPASNSRLLSSSDNFYNELQYIISGGIQYWDADGPNVASAATIGGIQTRNADGNAAAVRTNSTTITVASGSLALSASIASTALDDGNIYIAARDNGAQQSNPGNIYHGTIKAAACGMGLTVGQAQTLFGIVNTYEAAMGRAGVGQ